MPARIPDLVLNYKKNRACLQLDLVIPVDRRVKTKESEKIEDRRILGPCKKEWKKSCGTWDWWWYHL